MNGNMEELITALYDMIQDAKSMPLSSDKCIIEREKALDMLDELTSLIPEEVRQAQSIVQSREALVSQARHESESIIKGAHERAEQLVSQEAIYQEALQRCQMEVQKTNLQMEQIKAASFDYMDKSLLQTEEAMMQALNEVRETRARFQSITAQQPASEG